MEREVYHDGAKLKQKTKEELVPIFQMTIEDEFGRFLWGRRGLDR